MRGKKAVGRKRHVIVDTLGLVWALVVTPADVQDRDGAKLALAAFRSVVKFPEVIWADTAYRSVVRWARGVSAAQPDPSRNSRGTTATAVSASQTSVKPAIRANAMGSSTTGSRPLSVPLSNSA